MCGLVAAVSCWLAVVSGELDVFELKPIDEWLQAISHGLGGVWVDDKYRAHLAISGVTTVAVFAH